MMIMFMMMTSIDHSHDGNDDDESCFHCELIEAVLWVLVGLLFVGQHCCGVYCQYCVLSVL